MVDGVVVGVVVLVVVVGAGAVAVVGAVSVTGTALNTGVSGAVAVDVVVVDVVGVGSESWVAKTDSGCESATGATSASELPQAARVSAEKVRAAKKRAFVPLKLKAFVLSIPKWSVQSPDFDMGMTP